MVTLRECVIKLSEQHPLKRWLKWIATSGVINKNKKEEEIKDYLVGVINSQFNLLTSSDDRSKINHLIGKIPEFTLAEKLLKSYLYLIIGNVTRSDNIIRSIILTNPRRNWSQSTLQASVFHSVAEKNIEQLFEKFKRHPSNRRIFQLLCLYIKNFYNDSRLIRLAGEVDVSEALDLLDLKYTESLAPSLVKYLKIIEMDEKKRLISLRDVNTSQEFLLYWFSPFVGHNFIFLDKMIDELTKIQNDDPVWHIYLLDSEKLADLYSKKSGKSFLPSRRKLLKEKLNSNEDFMMSLFKLIELGDFGEDVVVKALEYLVHD